ncbi:MAG: putative DNA binding domain-containing protein [Draconibacterium sp.]|nr:putative DNA binding domain-containing protein [Draconibacterium sp.]
MTEKELKHYLQTHFPRESTSCEWKEFRNLKHFVKGHEGEDIISYVSAIANMEGGQLVIGVEDNTLNITGIEDFHNYTSENIVLKILEQTPNLSSEGFYIEPFTTTDTSKTVWVFHIPKHQPRKPVLAHNKPWQRVENSLVRIRPEREQAILNEPLAIVDDWSAEICKEASIASLSETAIAKARENYKNKFPEQAADVDVWDDITFLNKAKITKRGKITNAAIVLLGKSESEHYINPAIAKIRWILKDKDNIEKDYTVLPCPFLLNAEEIYNKIRKVKYRYMREGSLFPEEIDQYEPYVIREAINNCIAHQDYRLGGYINVVENEDGYLTFSNLGSFIPGSIERVIREDAPEEHYRNPFLAAAMFNLKMVDTIGSGIKRMFNYQRQRFFPMPDYQFTNNKVVVKVTGKVLDLQYSRVLAQIPSLTLNEIMMLDKVQKKLSLTDWEINRLREKKLIEGRKPNFFISVTVAKVTGHKATYIRNKAFDDAHYKDMITSYLKKFTKGKRNEIENLIIPKLSEVLDEKQKKDKVKNILQTMRKDNIIRLVDKEWVLV